MIVVLLLTRVPLAHGCGVDWGVPVNHFDGVNEQGQVSYWEKIADLDLGEDLVLPIIVNFRSGRDMVSPYLGKGWLLALLESCMGGALR